MYVGVDGKTKQFIYLVQCNICVNHDEVWFRDQSTVIDVWCIQDRLLTLTLTAALIAAPYVITQVMFPDNLQGHG